MGPFRAQSLFAKRRRSFEGLGVPYLARLCCTPPRFVAVALLMAVLHLWQTRHPEPPAQPLEERAGSAQNSSAEPLVSSQPSIDDVLYSAMSSFPGVREEEQRRLWGKPESSGWQPASSHRSNPWPPPQMPSNGYLMVRCNGGLNQQRSAICNAVLAARLMNATLVLPQLDANDYWHDTSGFEGIYDVERFIATLRGDVEVVRELPAGLARSKRHQLNPPREAHPEWYTSTALDALKRHGLLYLTPFAHRLAEELGGGPTEREWQRLRCRVNFEALKFVPAVERLAAVIEGRLRESGPFVAVHLRFEMDMLAFAGCVDIFRPEEQRQLIEYRRANFAEKRLESTERRRKGKCPLTPVEVGLVLRALGYPNTTRVYIAAGELFGGDRFMAPLRAMFPFVTNRSTVATTAELAPISGEGKGLLGSAVDYLLCVQADVFMPTYDGPSNFANNVVGHRLYWGFRTTIQPNRKGLAPLLEELQRGRLKEEEFNRAARRVMYETSFGAPHPREPHESFYTNPWPECFCQSKRKGLDVGEDDVCSALDILGFALKKGGRKFGGRLEEKEGLQDKGWVSKQRTGRHRRHRPEKT